RGRPVRPSDRHRPPRRHRGRRSAGPVRLGRGSLMTKSLKVMLVAAEASGDALGAGLAKALKTRLGDDVGFVGVGGPKMAAEGVISPFDIADLSIFGWIDGLRAYGRVKARVADTVALAVRERPDVVVLIDSWGFTIRVAKALRAAL